MLVRSNSSVGCLRVTICNNRNYDTASRNCISNSFGMSARRNFEFTSAMKTRIARTSFLKQIGTGIGSVQSLKERTIFIHLELDVRFQKAPRYTISMASPRENLKGKKPATWKSQWSIQTFTACSSSPIAVVRHDAMVNIRGAAHYFAFHYHNW